jgi:hypothetical protein
VLKTVRSEDSSVFSGLSNVSPERRLKRSKSGSGKAIDSDVEVELVEDRGRSQDISERFKVLSEDSEESEPPFDDNVLRSYGNSIPSSDSTEERNFLRHSLPNMADTDTAFGTETVFSESQFNEECGYNEEVDDDVDLDDDHDDDPTVDLPFEDKDLTLLATIQLEKLTNNEERISAIFDDYEKKMDADLQGIREDVDDSFEKSFEGVADTDDYLYAIQESPRQVKSEEERQVLTHKQAKEMQRVLHQARREVEVLRDNNEQFMSEIEQTEEEHESEMQLVENRTKQKMTELKALHQHEIDLLIQEKDAAIVEAGNQAARYTEVGRQQISTLKKQIEKYKSQYKNFTKAAVKDAVKRQTEKVKQQKEEEFSRELASLHEHYEDKLEKIKSDNNKEIKSAVDKAVNHLTLRLTSDREQDVSETIILLRKRLENEKQIALDEQRTTLQKNAEEFKKWGNELMREKHSVKQMLELLKANLMKHHEEKINKVLMQEPSERPGSKYFDSIPETLSTGVEKLCQEVLSTHASLLVYAETNVQMDGNAEIRMGDEMEEIRKERNEVYVNLRKKLQAQHQAELEEMKKHKEDATDRIQHLEAALKNMGRDKRFIEDKFRRATESNKVELQKLHAEKDTMLEMEKGRKELAVAMAAGQYELAHTMTSARDHLVRPGQKALNTQKTNGKTVLTDIAIKSSTTERAKEKAGQPEAAADREIMEQKKAPAAVKVKKSAAVKDQKQNGKESAGFKLSKKLGLRSKSHAGIFGLSFKKAEAISRTVDEEDDFNFKSAASAASAPSKLMGVDESILKQAPSVASASTKRVRGDEARLKKATFSSSNSDASSAVGLRSYASTALSNFKVKKAPSEVSAAPKDTMGIEKSDSTAPVQEPTTPEQVAEVKKTLALATPHFLTQQNSVDDKLADRVKPKDEPIGTRASVEDDLATKKGFPILNAFKSTSQNSADDKLTDPVEPKNEPIGTRASVEDDLATKKGFPILNAFKSTSQNSADDKLADPVKPKNEPIGTRASVEDDLATKKGFPILNAFKSTSRLSTAPQAIEPEGKLDSSNYPEEGSDTESTQKPTPPKVQRMRNFFENMSQEDSCRTRTSYTDESTSSLRVESGAQSPRSRRRISDLRRIPQSPSDERDELQTLDDTTNDDGRELPPKDSYQTGESPHVPSIHQSRAISESPTQSEMGVQVQGLKNTTPLGMFAQLSKTSKTAQEPSVAKDQVSPRQKRSSGGVCDDGNKGGNGPPPSSAAFTIKLRKTWMHEEPTPAANVADETEKRDEEPTDEPCIHQNLRKPPLPGFPGRLGEKSLPSVHVLNGKKPPIAGNPDNINVHNLRKIGGQSGDYGGKVPTTISVHAGGKQQYVSPAVKGHTLCIAPLPVAKKSQPTTEHHLENKVSGLSIASNDIEALADPTPETADTTDYNQDSQSRLRNYPPLGDESDDESNESVDKYDSAEDLGDRYTTFTPVQFANTAATTSVQPDGKRVPVVLSRSVDSPVFYMESMDENPIVVQGQPIYRQPSLSAFSPTRESASKDISSAGSTTETSVSQATTAVTAHTLQSFRSTHLKDSSSKSLKGQSAGPPRGSGLKRIPGFAATLRARRKKISSQ